MTAHVRHLAALASMLVLAACQRAPEHPWPADMVENFLRGCRPKTTEAQCLCAVDQLQRRFTVEEFQEFERQLAGGTVPKAMADAITGCASR